MFIPPTVYLWIFFSEFPIQGTVIKKQIIIGICLYTTLYDTIEQPLPIQTERGESYTSRKNFMLILHASCSPQLGFIRIQSGKSINSALCQAQNGCSEDGVISPNVSALLREKGYVDTRCYYFLSKSCFLDWQIGLIGPPLCCAQMPFKTKSYH